MGLVPALFFLTLTSLDPTLIASPYLSSLCIVLTFSPPQKGFLLCPHLVRRPRPRHSLGRSFCVVEHVSKLRSGSETEM